MTPAGPQFRSVGPAIWLAEAPFALLGCELGARMTVVRLKSGDLWLHSPVEVATFSEQVGALGNVGHLVAPNRFHTLDLEGWQQANPGATLYAAPGIAPEGAFAGSHSLNGEPVAAWGDEIDYVLLRGSRLVTEAVFFHRASRTLILTDAAFNVPHTRPAFTRLVAGMLGVLDHFGPSRTFKLALRDKAAARTSLQQILAWDFDRVVLSHGTILETGGKTALIQAYSWLLR